MARCRSDRVTQAAARSGAQGLRSLAKAFTFRRTPSRNHAAGQQAIDPSATPTDPDISPTLKASGPFPRSMRWMPVPAAALAISTKRMVPGEYLANSTL